MNRLFQHIWFFLAPMIPRGATGPGRVFFDRAQRQAHAFRDVYIHVAGLDPAKKFYHKIKKWLTCGGYAFYFVASYEQREGDFNGGIRIRFGENPKRHSVRN